MEETPYSRYKQILTPEEFYATWNPEDLENINASLMESIYKRYVVKCTVFQRDNFTCQNENCPYCNNVMYTGLTLHHIKFQRNGGEDKPRNCITVCQVAHKNFHRKKDSLTFWGMTYKEHKEKEINWKEIKAKGKEIRKAHMDEFGITISWEMMLMLLKFLNIDYTQYYDDEDES